MAATAKDGWERPNETRSPPSKVMSREEREPGRARVRGGGADAAEVAASWGGTGPSSLAGARLAVDVTAGSKAGHG